MNAIPYTVALTGGIASGKSTVAKQFERYNITVIDADLLARQVVEPERGSAYVALFSLLGSDMFDQQGQLIRHELRQSIFDHKNLKSQVEAIIHPAVFELMIEQRNASRSAYVIVMIPLLYETGRKKWMDRILVVDVTPQQQRRRLCDRDQISIDDANKIIAAQATPTERLSLADDVICNNAMQQDSHRLIEQLHRSYIKMASLKINSKL